MSTAKLTGVLFQDMLQNAAANLRENAQRINNLNVFPIPDGDTGDNMSMTIDGGIVDLGIEDIAISDVAKSAANGMLFSARGNSGVILSQFFEGLAKGFCDKNEVDANELCEVFSMGVKQAYSAVSTPQEGTILTVMREATENTSKHDLQSIEEFFEHHIEYAKTSLQNTPNLLPVLKEAGVIDSGGEGYICVILGMYAILTGEVLTNSINYVASSPKTIDFSGFDENSTMDFGYCTEVLLQLTNSKCDPAGFDIDALREYLSEIGNSVVTFRNGTVIKLHVHTLTPEKVLSYCHNYGEFLTLKIENMSLQHTALGDDFAGNQKEEKKKEHSKIGIVAVGQGAGIKTQFEEFGCDVVVDGGPQMNPSAADLISAFDKADADDIVLLPNDSNILLTSEQAAKLYPKSRVHVVHSTTLAQGYTALTMLDLSCGDAEQICEELSDAASYTITGLIAKSAKDTTFDSTEVQTGEWIGLCDKKLLSHSNSVIDTAKQLVDNIDIEDREVLIMICGKDSNRDDIDQIKDYIQYNYSDLELYEVDGGQSHYDYIFAI